MPTEPSRRTRAVATVPPACLAVVDAATIVGLAAEGHTCTTDCLSGALLTLTAPTLLPLRWTGFTDAGGTPSLVTVLPALLLVLVLVAVFWWWWGGVAADLTHRDHRALRWWLVVLLAVPWLVLVKLPAALDGALAAAVGEAVLWAAFVAGISALTRRRVVARKP